MDRLEKINPFYREKALVREITLEKSKVTSRKCHS